MLSGAILLGSKNIHMVIKYRSGVMVSFHDCQGSTDIFTVVRSSRGSIVFHIIFFLSQIAFFFLSPLNGKTNVISFCAICDVACFHSNFYRPFLRFGEPNS